MSDQREEFEKWISDAPSMLGKTTLTVNEERLAYFSWRDCAEVMQSKLDEAYKSIKASNVVAEKFEREWYLRGDELEKDNAEILVVNHDEAHQLALIRPQSNLARCYLELEHKSKAFEATCDDIDKILTKLGLIPDECWTEGGVLQVTRINNHVQETLDALTNSMQFGIEMSNKYAAVCKQLCDCRRKCWLTVDGMKKASF